MLVETSERGERLRGGPMWPLGGAFCVPPKRFSMATTSYQAQLESVQAAIAAIEASPNASVSILGRSFTKHDLKTLYDREQWLRGRAAREAVGGRRAQRVIPI